MVKDFKYILKRVIIGILIGLFFFLLKSFNVLALTNSDMFSDLTIPGSNGEATFFSNNNGALSYKGYSLLQYGDIYYALPATPDYFYGNYGGALNMCNLSFVQNNYYSLTYVFVTSYGQDYIWPNYSAQGSKLGISNIVGYYALTFSFETLTEGIQVVSVPGLTPIGDEVYSYTIIFKAPSNGTCLSSAFTSRSKTLSSTEVGFLGYKYESLGSKPLTSTEMTTIINNSNQNVINNINSSISSTQRAIIDNANANNQALIDANAQNTQDMINSQKSCSLINKNNISTDNYFLDSSGYKVSSSNYGITDFIPINGSSFKVLIRPTAVSGVSSCFYDMNKNVISCIKNNDLVPDTDLNIPSNAYFVVFSIWKSQNVPVIEVCKNGNQAISDNLNDLNNSINDDNVDANDSQINDLINDSSFQDNTGLSSVINAPLSIITHLTDTCTPINLHVPYIDFDLSIPCMSTSVYTKFDSSLITVVKAIVNGFLIYRVIVSLYGMIKGFKDPESDKVEVVDL